MRKIAYISLGSNLGDRQATLRVALEELGLHPAVAVRQVSSFVETAPVLTGSGEDTVGPADQPAYLNAAAELHTTLPPLELLDALQAVEAKLGRNRQKETRWGPRCCDLDLLLYDKEILDSPRLTLPHPRMAEREFVLVPLSQIAPEAICPTKNKTILTLLEELTA